MLVLMIFHDSLVLKLQLQLYLCSRNITRIVHYHQEIASSVDWKIIKLSEGLGMGSWSRIKEVLDKNASKTVT